MYEELAMRFTGAMKSLAGNEDLLNNFCSYLTYHFPEWLEKYSRSPESLTDELELFASFEW